MLTLEQIRNLKHGHKLVHEIRFVEGCGDYIKCAFSPLFSRDKTTFLIDRSFLSLPSEIVNSQSSIVNKYDPTRLFKKGDVVTPRIYLGRKDKELEMGEKYIVTADEIAGDMVAIKHHFTLRPDIVQTCFLELVTPVEELEPYKLIDSPNTYNIVRDSAMVMTIHKKSHPNAKAAAEAECARLNAEWRKEQNND